MSGAGVQEFLSMGGYGPYVWGSFGVVLLTVVAEWVALQQRYKLARLHAQTARRREAA